MRPPSPTPLLLLALALCACSSESSEGPPTYEGPGTPVPAGPGGTPALSNSALPGTALGASASTLDQPEPVNVVRQDLARVDVPASVHDFGEVWQGVVLGHTFELTVRDGPDLVVNRIVPGCSCTEGELTVLEPNGTRRPLVIGEALPPGTRLEVGMLLHTQGRRDELFKQPRLYANVPSGMVLFTLLADIQLWVEVEPNMWNAGRLSATDSRESEVRIFGTNTPFALTADTQGVGEGLTVELTPVDPADDGRALEWTARITAGPGLPRGPMQLPVAFVTDMPVEGAEPGPDGALPHHKADMLVRAEVVGVVTASPSALGFGLLKPDVLTTKSVLVSSADLDHLLAQPTWEIQDDQGQPLGWDEFLTVTARPFLQTGAGVDRAPKEGGVGEDGVERHRSWRLELTIDGLPEDVSRVVRGRLVIHTDHPAEPRIEINFTGFTNNALGTRGTAGRR